MRADEERRDALLAEVAEQLVQLHREKPLVGHRTEIAVEAVDDDDAHAVLLDGVPNRVRELAGRELRGIDRAELDATGPDVRRELDAQPGGTGLSSVWTDSSKRNIALFWPRAAAAETNSAASVDLPTPAAPTMSVLVPPSMPPPSSASRAGSPLASVSCLAVPAGVRRRQAVGRHCKAASPDDEVVIPGAELPAAVLDDAKPTALAAEIRCRLLEVDDAVGDALDLEIVIGGREIVEQDTVICCPAKNCLSARIWRRYRSALPASRRSSDRESMTTRDGLMRSTSDSTPRVVSPSSTSDGWNIVYCASGWRFSGAGASCRIVTPSSDQPCDRAAARSSSSVSDSVT